MSVVAPLLALFALGGSVLGGIIALRLRHRLPATMAFTGGIVLAVALLDVLPEAIEALDEPQLVGALVMLGFLWFFLLERVVVLHHRDTTETAQQHAPVGSAAAAAIALHAFVDGFGIATAFAESTRLGVIFLAAVVAHDFADGMNTVTFVLAQGGTVERARRWLGLTAAAPVLGALVGSFFDLSERTLGYGFALYTGVFLAIGASELIPEAHDEPSAPRVALTLAGVAAVGAVTLIVEGSV